MRSTKIGNVYVCDDCGAAYTPHTRECPSFGAPPPTRERFTIEGSVVRVGEQQASGTITFKREDYERFLQQMRVLGGVRFEPDEQEDDDDFEFGMHAIEDTSVLDAVLAERKRAVTNAHGEIIGYLIDPGGEQ